ncbi:MAG TPA: hypothetical protein VNF06_02965 [Candidatus Aquilonibacter sp.]|nr:hypothetical protein [Candidatus Aquilonibacter sp.]
MSFTYKTASEARQNYNFAMDTSEGKKAQPYFALLIAQRNLGEAEMVAPLKMLISDAIKKNKAESLQELLYRYDKYIAPDLKEHIVEIVVKDKASRGEYIEAVDYAILSKDCSAHRLAVEFHKKAIDEKRFDVAAAIWDRYKLGPDNMNDAAVRLYLSQIKRDDEESALFTIKMYRQTLQKYLLPVATMKARRAAEKIIEENSKGKMPSVEILFSLPSLKN